MNFKMKICASIGEPTYLHLEKSVKRAFEVGADLVELRLDYLKDALDVQQIKRIIDGCVDRCILTLRSNREGGLFKGSEEERLQLIHQLSELKPAYLDVELDAVKREKKLSEVCEGVTLIVSKHSFTHTPNQSTLSKWVKEVLRLGSLGKVVTTAKNFRDNITIIEILKRAPKGRLISFCMGELGLVSRILSPLLGSPIFYASLKKATASGQIELSDAVKLYRVLRV
ncbi:MAG: type I 3-dehydroquinate dehydratase [Nitrososphaerales archaeon]